jgi:hypothetical protein
MHMNIDQKRLFRVPLFSLIMLVSMGSFAALATASSDEVDDENTIRGQHSEHGNNGGLSPYLVRLDLPISEESREGKEVTVPVFSPPRLRLDLFIPFIQNDAIRPMKRKFKPRVVRRIKLNRAKRRR